MTYFRSNKQPTARIACLLYQAFYGLKKAVSFVMRKSTAVIFASDNKFLTSENDSSQSLKHIWIFAESQWSDL